jgi:hypothetical protein
MPVLDTGIHDQSIWKSVPYWILFVILRSAATKNLLLHVP